MTPTKKLLYPVLGTLLFFFLLPSCNYFGYTPLTIVEYSPDNGQIDASLVTQIEIRFSEPVSAASAEQAFRLTQREGEVFGLFTWPDKSTLVFEPIHPLQSNKIYTLRVQSSLEDQEGNNLEKEFYFQFGSLSDLTPPNNVSFLSIEAVPGEDLRPLLQFTFPEEIPQSSFLDTFSLTPSFFYSLATADGIVYEVTPLQDLDPQTLYTVSIGTGLKDTAGNTSNQSWSWDLRVGPGDIDPTVTQVQETATSTNLILYDSSTPEIEKTLGIPTQPVIQLSFDQPMEADSVESALSFSPAASHTFDWSDENTLTISFESSLPFDQEVFFRMNGNAMDKWGNPLSEALWIFQTDHPDSQPPVVTALYFGALGTPLLVENETISIYDFTGTDINAELRIELECAPGASLNVFNAIENVLLSLTDTASTLSIRTAEIDTSGPNPQIRLGLNIVSTAFDPGFLEVKVFDGLKDQLGRKMDETYQVTLFASNSAP